MPSTATAPTMTPAQLRAAGTRLLGFYEGGGGVKLDALADLSHFATRAADGAYRLAGNLVIGFAPAPDIYNLGIFARSPFGGTIDYDIKTVDASNGAKDIGTIRSTGDIGIGTELPIGRLHVNTPSAAESLIWCGNNTNGACVGMVGGNKPGIGVHSGQTLYVMGQAGAFATTLATINENGIGIGATPSFPIHISRADQSVARIRIQNTAVGGRAIDLVSGIHSASQGDFSIYDATNAGTLFAFGVNYFRPGGDNSVSCGTASYRFSEVRAVNGSIITSDETEKTWRSTPTLGELAAGRRIIGELGFYQWNDAIAEKGDEARYHFGPRAQRVWAIMADEGLIEPIVEGETPTSSYAFLCYDEGPAEEPIEAVEEVLGEDGEVLVAAQAALPGREAWSRFGVRPDQLIMFLIAAQEARLAALEAA